MQPVSIVQSPRTALLAPHRDQPDERDQIHRRIGEQAVLLVDGQSGDADWKTGQVRLLVPAVRRTRPWRSPERCEERKPCDEAHRERQHQHHALMDWAAV